MVSVPRKVLLFGATKGMGRALARRMARRGDHLFLVGRDADDLSMSASDLEVYADEGMRIGTAVCDLDCSDTFAPAFDQAEAFLDGVDTVVLTAARFATPDALTHDRVLAQQLLQTDFVNTVMFCELARARLLARGGGTLCVFSSVAGDRGRNPVSLYGAAKAGLSAYLEGLDHTYRRAGLITVCVKPGFVRTGMTVGLRVPPFAGTAEGVARQVLRAIDRGTPIVYAPSMWASVMRVVRWLPRSVMRRIPF